MMLIFVGLNHQGPAAIASTHTLCTIIMLTFYQTSSWASVAPLSFFCLLMFDEGQVDEGHATLPFKDTSHSLLTQEAFGRTGRSPLLKA